MTTKTKIITVSALTTLAGIFALGIFTAHTERWKNLETNVNNFFRPVPIEAVSTPILSPDEIAINSKIADPEFQALMRQYATGLVQREKQIDLDHKRLEAEKKADDALNNFALKYDSVIQGHVDAVKQITHDELVSSIRQSKI